MKSVPIALILILGLSFNYASLVTNKGSTILDYLKDGFDAVYKFKEQSSSSYQKLKDFKGKTFDIHLRKSSSKDDPKKFVMHLKNVQLTGVHEEQPSNTDLEALVLPIIIAVQNEDLDLDELHVTEADTKKSLSWKYDALLVLLTNMTEEVSALMDETADINSILLGIPMVGPFGYCIMQLSPKKINGQIGFEMSTRRDQCIGALDKNLVEEISEFDATDINGRSEMKFGFYYDKVTGQFLRTFLKMRAKMSLFDKEMVFSIEMELQFDTFKEIEEIFDETMNTKLYKEADLLA